MSSESRVSAQPYGYEQWYGGENVHSTNSTKAQMLSAQALRSAFKDLDELCPRFHSKEERTAFTKSLEELYKYPIRSTQPGSTCKFRDLSPEEKAAGFRDMYEMHTSPGNRALLEEAYHATRHLLSISSDQMPWTRTDADDRTRELVMQSYTQNEEVQAAFKVMASVLDDPRDSWEMDPTGALRSVVRSVQHHEGPYFPAALGVSKLRDEVRAVLRPSRWSENFESNVQSAAKTVESWWHMANRLEQSRLVGNVLGDADDPVSSLMRTDKLMESVVLNRKDLKEQTRIRSAFLGIGPLIDLDMTSFGDTCREVFSAPIAHSGDFSKLSPEDICDKFRDWSDVSKYPDPKITLADVKTAFEVIDSLHPETLVAPWLSPDLVSDSNGVNVTDGAGTDNGDMTSSALASEDGSGSKHSDDIPTGTQLETAIPAGSQPQTAAADEDQSGEVTIPDTADGADDIREQAAKLVLEPSDAPAMKLPVEHRAEDVYAETCSTVDTQFTDPINTPNDSDDDDSHNNDDE